MLQGSEGRNEYENALRSNDGDENDKGGDGTEEDALHLRVVGDDLWLPVLDDRSFHVVTAYSLDLRGCRRYHLLGQGHLSINSQATLYSRTTYVSQLVCNTGEGGTESGWTHLGQLYRDHTPCTLYAKLHTESASRKRTEARRNNPERNENPAQRNK